MTTVLAEPFFISRCVLPTGRAEGVVAFALGTSRSKYVKCVGKYDNYDDENDGHYEPYGNWVHRRHNDLSRLEGSHLSVPAKSGVC